VAQSHYVPHTQKKWEKAKKDKPDGAWLKAMVDLYLPPKGHGDDDESDSDEDGASTAMVVIAKDVSLVVSSLPSNSASSSPGVHDDTQVTLPSLPPRDPKPPKKRKSTSSGAGADAEQRLQKHSSDGKVTKHRSKSGLFSLCFIIS
jgi:hypothetical protein